MPNIHDPYLDTVRRNLKDERIKSRKDRITKINEEKFLSQKVSIHDYIYLPEELEKLFIFSAFIIVPYFTGIVTLLILLGYQAVKELLVFNFDLFMLLWTAGYEVLTLILLTLILKSAFTFKKRNG